MTEEAAEEEASSAEVKVAAETAAETVTQVEIA